MRHVVATAALVLASCVTPGGQKVTVLLSNRTVTCEPQGEDQPALATLQLEQEEDFYQAEFRDLDDGSIFVLGADRVGRTVTFECPAGVEEFVVRHATVLQARVADDGGGDAPAPGGGAAAPTATGS